jgi:molybdopterin molybdotransferase
VPMVVESDSPQRIARLTPLGDVLARLEAQVKPVPPRASDLSGALGWTLAEDVVANAPVPAAARALCDGWAVRSDHTADAGAYGPAPLPSAVRIDVGQPLTGDADAVTPLDTVTMRNGVAQALAPVGPGDGVLSAGADVARGATLLEAGRRLARLQIEVLAAAGITSVRIRTPRLRLVRVGQRGDAFIDAAFACVADAIGSMGGVAVIAESDGLAIALADAAVDAVVVVGGTGSGRNDATVRTLASVGEVHVHGIALLPGETAALGAVGSRPVLVLPGRLDAALAAWHLLGHVMLARLAGRREPAALRSARLTHKVSSTVGLSELVPVRCDGPLASPIASGYLPLSVLAQANGWILIAPESEGYPAHTEVMVRPWP